MQPSEIQELQYNFPYHHLPLDQGGIWTVHRALGWGFEYLPVLDTVLTFVGKAIPNPSGEEKILDFGCGDGRLIVEIFAKYKPLKCIVGVDISGQALAYAQAFTYGIRNVKFFRNIKEVVATGDQFDVVVAMEVIEHIDPNDLPVVIDSIYTVMKPGGTFIVSVPTVNQPLNRKHYQHFSLKALQTVFGDRFHMDEARCIHKTGFLADLIRRAVVNRFFILNYPPWVRLCTWFYKRFVKEADEMTSANIICRFRKV